MKVQLPEVLRKSINIIPGVNIGPSKDAQATSGVFDPASWLIDVVAGVRSLSGESVNQATAFQLTAFYAAIRNISEDVAKLPFNIFERVGNGRKLRNDHPDFRLVHIQANPYTSQQALQQTLLHWAISFGNGYAEIVRNSLGQVVQMWPIHPSRVIPRFEGEKLFYDVIGNAARDERRVQPMRFSAEDIYHVSGLGGDGIVGYSIFSIASQALGKGLAVQNFGAAYFGNATSLSGNLEAPGKLTDEAYDRLRTSWDKLHVGQAGKAHKVGILEQGMKFKATSSTAAEAQLIESALHTMTEVAQLLRIPLPKIGVAAGLVKANFEAENISYHNDTLMPWIIRTGHEMDRKVIRDDKFFTQHEVIALTLGDSKTRTGVLKTLRNIGMLSINEGRRIEGLNQIDQPWADEYHMQSNITTVEAISEGKNLKQPPGGIGSKPTGESGVSENQVVVVEPVGIAYTFDNAKAAHMPIFKSAARRIITKESKHIKNLLKTKAGDLKGYLGRVETFFQKQKADIVEAFAPCCEVFAATFPSADVEIKLDFLEAFADNYAKDGIAGALDSFEKQVKFEVIVEDLAKDEENLAKNIINFMGANAKGVQDEAE